MPSVKFADNIYCWVCDHFQRYARGNTPLLCGGECRFNPPKASFSGDSRPAGTVTNLHYDWPVMVEGVTEWCGRFERTAEQNLPDYPHTVEGVCETALTLPDDRDDFWNMDDGPGPWNKKIEAGYVDSPEDGICCWNCDHFQPTAAGYPNQGTCNCYSPYCWQERDIGGAGSWMNATFEEILDGVCFWCAQWERARHTVPTPPGNGWVVCPVIQAV